MDESPGGTRRLVLVQSNAELCSSNDGAGKGATREQLEYLADTIRQMQVLAWQTGCARLAGLLEQAHREADEQRRKLGKRVHWFEPA